MEQHYLCPTPLSSLIAPFPSAAASSCFGVELCAWASTKSLHSLCWGCFCCQNLALGKWFACCAGGGLDWSEVAGAVLCGQAVLTSVPSVPKLCGENCCLLHLEDMLGSALLFARLDSRYCTGFLASGKLRKLALYSGNEASSGETLIQSVFSKLWFHSAILPVTLAKGSAKHWKFSYLDRVKSFFFRVLLMSSLLRVSPRPLPTLRSCL